MSVRAKNLSLSRGAYCDNNTGLLPPSARSSACISVLDATPGTGQNRAPSRGSATKRSIAGASIAALDTLNTRSASVSGRFHHASIFFGASSASGVSGVPGNPERARYRARKADRANLSAGANGPDVDGARARARVCVFHVRTNKARETTSAAADARVRMATPTCIVCTVAIGARCVILEF